MLRYSLFGRLAASAVVSLGLLIPLTPTTVASTRTYAIAYPKPLQVGDFALRDTRGLPFSAEQLKGRWSLVAMGFTNCPDICPTTLQKLALIGEALSGMRAAQRLQIVFLAVDPDRDIPVLPEYVGSFRSGIIGVSGDWDEVKKAIITLRGVVQIIGKTPAAETYEVRHSAFINLISPDGILVARINPEMPVDDAVEYIRDTATSYKTE